MNKYIELKKAIEKIFRIKSKSKRKKETIRIT